MDTRTKIDDGFEGERTSPCPSSDETTSPGFVVEENVIATIARHAARGIAGIHRFGRFRLLTPHTGASATVAAGVESKAAVIDLEIVLDSGHDIDETCERLRQCIASEVANMAGRQVEVNVEVVDIHLPSAEQDSPTPKP